MSDLLLRVKLNLLSSKIQQKIVKQKSKVTQAEIEKYYKNNPKRFGMPEKRNLLIILTKTEDAGQEGQAGNRIGQELCERRQARLDRPDEQVKRRQAPGRGQGPGGEDRSTRRSSRPRRACSAARSRPRSATTSSRSQTITPGSQQTLKQAEGSIKSQLTATQQQAALSKFVKDFKKKWMAKTDCRAGYVVADCKSYKAPKTTSTASPGAATTPPATTTTPATTSTKTK